MAMDKMAEYLPLVKEVANLGLGLIVTFVFLGLVVYFAKKIHPLIVSQNTLIENNTRATEAVSQSVCMLGGILKEVTQNFAVHDQRASYMQRDIENIQRDIADIKKDATTKEELLAVHDRLDKQGENIARLCGKVGC